VLDPAIVPNTSVYILLRSSDGEQKTLGPYSIRRGTVLDLRIPSTLRGALVSIR
jgi:hypothetical protein